MNSKGCGKKRSLTDFMLYPTRLPGGAEKNEKEFSIARTNVRAKNDSLIFPNNRSFKAVTFESFSVWAIKNNITVLSSVIKLAV
jgi:hypothetical protein